MAITVTLNGVNYSIPDDSETGWGSSVRSWIQAVSQHSLQKSGGSFTLTAEVDFGATYGLVVAYLKSRTANPASAGAVRLARTDEIRWRDNANSSDLELGVNASDQLTWNGNPIVGSSALTASRALQSSGAGVIEASSVTSTELGYVSGVTSAIQTQLNAKVESSTFTSHTGATAAHGVSGSVVGTSDSQTLSNKTFSDAVQVAEIATPSTPSSGFGKIYPKADGKWYTLNDGGTETELGAGGATGINYIANPNAETDTSGWAGYIDASQAAPEDGTGGSPTTTWTRSTSSPLRGTANFLLTKDAANRQGEGVSYDFTVNAADQAKVLRVSFDYKTSSNYADGDVRVYIYRTTATARLIELSQRDLAANTVNGTYMGEFQTDSDATGYRLILHVASTNASAYTIQVDNVSVGPREIARGPSVLDPVEYNATVSGISVGVKKSFYEKVGSYLVGTVFIQANGVATAGITVSLPPGLTIDYTKLTSASYARVGDCSAYDASTATDYTGNVFTNNTSTTQVIMVGPSTAGIWGTGGGAPFTWASGDEIKLNFRIPIQGWSSNTAIGSDFGGRVLAARLHSSSTSVTSGGVKILFSTVEYDTASQVSSSTFTAKESGWYAADWRIETGAVTLSTSERFLSQLFKNGSFYAGGTRPLGNGASNIYVSCGASDVYLNAGDTLEVYAVSSQTVSASGGTTCCFSVHKIQSPQTLLGGPRQTMTAIKNSGTHTSTGNWQVVAAYDTKRFDDFGSFNTTTGLYTFSEAGRFLVSGTVGFATNATGSRGAAIQKNGANHLIGNFIEANTSGLATLCVVSGIIDVVAGDTAALAGYQSSGGNLNYDPAAVSSTNINIQRID